MTQSLSKALAKFSGAGPVAFEVKRLSMDGVFAGYASVFDVVDTQHDRVRRGAFAHSISSGAPVQLLWQHQADEPIGIIESVKEDARGLYVRGRLLLDVARAREAYALLKAGALRGLSIGYRVVKSRRMADSGVRELLAVELIEVSLVTFPANSAAVVTVVKAQGASLALKTAIHQALSVLRI